MKLLITGSVTLFLSYLVYKFSIHDKLMKTFSLDKNGRISIVTVNLTEAENIFEKVARDLVKDFEIIGFAAVSGIKDYDADELLKWTKWFFDLPVSTKMAIAKKAFNKTSPAVYRGYYPIVAGTHSFKEAFEAGVFDFEDYTRDRLPNDEELRNLTKTENGRFYMRNIVTDKNIYPISDDPESDIKFVKIIKKYNKIFQRVATTIFRLLLIGRGLNPSDFQQFFCDEALHTFRLLHYPTRLANPESIPENAWDGNQAMVTGAHHDSSLLTILATFHYPGIQINPPGFHRWIDLPTDKNTLLINIGALMSYMFDGELIATDHRVFDTGNDRYSVPFFFEGCFDTDLSKTFSGKPNAFVGEFTKYGPWVTNRTSQFYEYATTDFGVPD